MDSAKKAGHVRENGSVLARVEKRTLIWIAERLPLWINSDHLTLLGLTAMVVAGGAFWAAHLHPVALLVVVAALAVNWFGDSLDGTVARVRSHQRPNYGFYVDHVVDVVGAFFLFGGMALSPYMSPVVALVLLVAYLMLSAEIYLATHARGVFRLSMFWMGPTELRILLSIGALFLLYKPAVVIAGTSLLLFDVGGVVAIVSMFFALAFSTVRNTRALYQAEPLPQTKTAAREAKQWTNVTQHAA
jgi:phosphatidylglycerophosphate synthase